MTPVVLMIGTEGGIGTTSIVFHLACMYADRGDRVLAVDLDPYAGLTKRFFDERRHADLFEGASHVSDGVRWLTTPRVEPVGRRLSVLVGAPQSATSSAGLAASLRRLWATSAADSYDLILVQAWVVSQAICRGALEAADHVVTVVAPDVFSLGGLTALGEWLRPGDTRPGGYIFGHAPPPVLASENARARWVDRVVAGYHAHVLGTQHGVTDPRRDPSCLGIMRNYSSLMSMAEESRKPMFSLTAADGALGSHAAAAQQAYGDFAQLADRVAAATWRRNPA